MTDRRSLDILKVKSGDNKPIRDWTYEGMLLLETDTLELYQLKGGQWVRFVGSSGSGVDSVNGFTGIVVLDTDDIAEATNLYFTDARAVTAIKTDADWNAADWDTAFSWGDHAAAGYLTTDPSPPGGTVDQVQVNDGAGGFAGVPVTYSAGDLSINGETSWHTGNLESANLNWTGDHVFQDGVSSGDNFGAAPLRIFGTDRGNYGRGLVRTLSGNSSDIREYLQGFNGRYHIAWSAYNDSGTWRSLAANERHSIIGLGGNSPGGIVGGNVFLGAAKPNGAVGDVVTWDGLLVDEDGNTGCKTTSPTEALDVNGKIRQRTQTSTTDADDIVATKGYVDATPYTPYALTDVTTTGQTRTLDVTNGPVQTIEATEDFTLNAAGPGAKIAVARLYVYNTAATTVTISDGANVLPASVGTIPAGETAVFDMTWDGTNATLIKTGDKAGDLRPT